MQHRFLTLASRSYLVVFLWMLLLHQEEWRGGRGRGLAEGKRKERNLNKKRKKEGKETGVEENQRQPQSQMTVEVWAGASPGLSRQTQLSSGS